MSNTIPELIAAHRAAWEAFQVAPAELSEDWENALHDALDALCFTPIASQEDARLLAQHLDWYASPEGEGEHAEQHALAIRAALYWAQSRGMALLLECR